MVRPFAEEILAERKHTNRLRRHVMSTINMITDHYAIIPTGQGLRRYASVCNPVSLKVYETIVRRFPCVSFIRTG